MDKFKVGQLVRQVIGSRAVPRGAIGEITKAQYVNRYGAGYDVLFPGCPSPHVTTEWHVKESWIEPVIDDGKRKIDWSQCAWRPWAMT
jgi:hypothetical protein